MIVERDGVLEGPLRRPVNPTLEVAGSIHNDATAQRLGFRGGTIAGSIHMEQLPPLLLRAFGPRWLEQGSLSLYFLHATSDREPVRGFMRLAETGTQAPADVWMETKDGVHVCEGSASVGASDPPSALRVRLEQLRPPGELRMLAGIEPGAKLDERPARITRAAQEERVDRVTEPLEIYTETDHPVATAAAAVQALRSAESGLDALAGVRAVGLFGAIELENVTGPVRVERDYVASGRVLAVVDSPKTEGIWYESTLVEPGSSDPVARMVMLLRFMKASSKLWQS